MHTVKMIPVFARKDSSQIAGTHGKEKIAKVHAIWYPTRLIE
jgi:hypothetical protein